MPSEKASGCAGNESWQVIWICWISHITYHITSNHFKSIHIILVHIISCMFDRLSYVKCHTPDNINNISQITYYISHITYHISYSMVYYISYYIDHIIYHIRSHHTPYIKHHMSYIIYHVSYSIYHIPCIIYHISSHQNSYIDYHISHITAPIIYHISQILIVGDRHYMPFWCQQYSSSFLSWFSWFGCQLQPPAPNTSKTSTMFAQTLPKHAKTKDRGQDSALCLHDRQGLVLGVSAVFFSPSLLVSWKRRMRVASAQVVFVGVAILGSILAYEGERTSRASFRSKVKAGQVESSHCLGLGPNWAKWG